MSIKLSISLVGPLSEFKQTFAQSATYDENLAFLRTMLQALHRCGVGTGVDRVGGTYSGASISSCLKQPLQLINPCMQVHEVGCVCSR